MRGREAVMAEAGPPCLKCAHVGSERPTPCCHHLVYTARAFEPAVGVVREGNYRLITSARSADGLCGPEALLFEPMPLGQRIRARVQEPPFIGQTVGLAIVLAILAAIAV